MKEKCTLCGNDKEPTGMQLMCYPPITEMACRKCQPGKFPCSSFDVKRQYEAALKKSVWGGTGLPPVGVEFEYGTHRTRAKCLAIGHHMVFASKGDPDDEDGDFEEFMISIQDSEFHEVRSKRDEAVHTIAELCRSAASNGHSADLIYDAIAAGKITGVKLSD